MYEPKEYFGLLPAIAVCGAGYQSESDAVMNMYDMSRNTALGYFDANDADARYADRVAYNKQRTADLDEQGVSVMNYVKQSYHYRAVSVFTTDA